MFKGVYHYLFSLARVVNFLRRVCDPHRDLSGNELTTIGEGMRTCNRIKAFNTALSLVRGVEGSIPRRQGDRGCSTLLIHPVFPLVESSEPVYDLGYSCSINSVPAAAATATAPSSDTFLPLEALLTL